MASRLGSANSKTDEVHFSLNVRLVGSQVVVFAVALSCLGQQREAVTMSALC